MSLLSPRRRELRPVGHARPLWLHGRMHDAGLLYLRARWYDAGSGVFVQRDPFAGFAERPYSLHPYQYGYANPLVNTDPTGKTVWSQGITEDNPTDQLVHHLYYFSMVRPEVTNIKLLLLGSNSLAVLALSQPCIGLSVAQLRAPAYVQWREFVKADTPENDVPLDVKNDYKRLFGRCASSSLS